MFCLAPTLVGRHGHLFGSVCLCVLGDVHSHAEDYMPNLELFNYVTFVSGASILTDSDSSSDLDEYRVLGPESEFSDTTAIDCLIR